MRRNLPYDNSILRMAKSLLSAAIVAGVAPGLGAPQITLRLTRLLPARASIEDLCASGLRLTPALQSRLTDDPDFEETPQDYRIFLTIKEVLKMGLDVQIGDHDFQPTASSNVPFTNGVQSKIVPTLSVNLDLSVLIALVSDTTHAPVPNTMEEANARFIPSHQEQTNMDMRKQARQSVKLGSKEANAGGTRVNPVSHF